MITVQKSIERGPENRITVHADKINNVVCLCALFHTRGEANGGEKRQQSAERRGGSAEI